MVVRTAQIRQGVAAYLAVVALVVALTVLEFTRDRVAARAAPSASQVAGRPGTAERIPFPPGSELDSYDGFVTSGDSARSTGIWGVRRTGDDLELQPWVPRDDGIEAGSPVRVPGGAAAGGGGIDVGRWSDRHDRAVLLAVARRGGYAVEVRDLDRPRTIVTRGQTPALPARPEDGRTIAFATHGGNRPDMIVVDRAGEAGRATVRVFSGESRFRELVQLTTIPFSGFPQYRWWAEAGAVSSARADLAMITRSDETNSGRVELHVLTASSGYRAWGLQIPLAERAKGSYDHWFLLAHRDRQPFIYAINQREGRLTILTL